MVKFYIVDLSGLHLADHGSVGYWAEDVDSVLSGVSSTNPKCWPFFGWHQRYMLEEPLFILHVKQIVDLLLFEKLSLALTLHVTFLIWDNERIVDLQLYEKSLGFSSTSAEYSDMTISVLELQLSSQDCVWPGWSYLCGAFIASTGLL